MLLLMKVGSAPADVERVLVTIRDLGFRARSLIFQERVLVRVDSDGPAPDPSALESIPGVTRAIPTQRPLTLVVREADSAAHPVRVGTREIGRGGLTLIAGPCAVESEEQLLPMARRLKEAGVDLLRGGAYKPRSSPYDFQGLGEDGLRILARARDETGLPVVTEAVDEASLELVERYADVIQIGARNMHNYALLKRAGESRLPVFLKRGMSAGLEDLLLAAEYLMSRGNRNLMLCERGIRTFSDHSRFTLDLSIVPRLKRITHLPVFVDPSHASGIRESVAPLARAAVAAGADGVMVEVHPEPLQALCDGPQSLRPDEFAALVPELRALAQQGARAGETVS